MTGKPDVFISHASPDKESFVRPLAEALRALGVEVWYDEFSLELGDSISQKIDSGIASSKFGIVVVSPAFIARNWTKHELRSLVSREVDQDIRIIPVWHGVTKKQVRTSALLWLTSSRWTQRRSMPWKPLFGYCER